MALFAAKRFEGTYNQVHRVEWANLQANEFGSPNWAELYPINAKGQPTGMLPPRLACKLFYDGILLVNKSEDNPKFYQDRLPECAYKFYKKKQWRKQSVEAGKRVVCRLALGKGFAPNCVAEEMFTYILLKDAFENGWRRIAEHIDPLPETDKDRDYNRVQRLVGTEDLGNVFRTGADETAAVAAKPKKEKGGKDEAPAAKKKDKADFNDLRSWFHAYEVDALHDHEIFV